MNTVSEEIKANLRQAAKEAAEFAYAPYSKFKVGAAVLFSDGSIETGCNVENASYGLTICAERNAVAKAVSKGKLQISYVIVYTPTAQPTSPCGACRQVINEFGPTAAVECICDATETIVTTLDRLLPNAFGPQNL